MSDVEAETFETTDAGAALTTPLQCSALRKNGHVLIKQRPCKVVEMSTSKTGKHGHAKVNLVGIDIFTGKKYEDICPSTHNVEVPKVKRKDYDLIDIDGEGFCTLMDDDATTKEDLKLPDNDIGKAIKEVFDKGDVDVMVTVVTAMGEEAILAYKNKTVKE